MCVSLRVHTKGEVMLACVHKPNPEMRGKLLCVILHLSSLGENRPKKS